MILAAREGVSDYQLAEELYRKWRAGAPKSRLEREYWGDGASHGKRFDRFIEKNLGIRPVKTRPPKGRQLRLDLGHYVVADPADRDQVCRLVHDIQQKLKELVDDPTLPLNAILLIEGIVLPKLAEVSALLTVRSNNEVANRTNIQRAKEALGEILTAAQTVVAIGADLGVGFAATVTTLAHVEPAVRGMKLIISGGSG